MTVHPLAGKPAPKELLVDLDALRHAYYDRTPDGKDPAQRVSFGTSGHRGSSLKGSFNETHILAITQAICDYRQMKGITGPLIMGKDSHALSEVAERSALEVLAANGVDTVMQQDDGYTPTPVISHAILVHNRGRTSGLGDGIVITPSHNPPEDGGFKYNPPTGGPADTETTGWIEDRANSLIAGRNSGVKRITWQTSLRSPLVHQVDLRVGYIEELSSVVDMDVIRDSGITIGVDPLGGSSVAYWDMIAERFGVHIVVTNRYIDPTFSFMTLDHDGKIRMDCSSPYAMAGLVAMKDRFPVAFGNDTDADRHGIVTRSAGLLNPNHYLAVAIHYLLTSRPEWPRDLAVGKTVVTSSLIDRIADQLGRKVVEVPVGFKWFAPGLFDGTICFGGEESAGASFLNRNGAVWTTDKDGIIMGLLAGEITARSGMDPGEYLCEITSRLGAFHYTRIDAPATSEEKAALKRLSPDAVTAQELAGSPITARLTRAPGNGAPIDGLKVETVAGWFTARPSGTENIYKLYAESFKSEEHLLRIVAEAQAIIARSLKT